jgi:hypothetical protein
LCSGTRAQWCAACLSFDYTCFSRIECVVDLTPELKRNLDAQASVKNMFALLLLLPPLIICSLTLLRAGLKWRRRRDLAAGIVREVGDSLLSRVTDRALTAIVDNMPATELVCSVSMVALLAPTLRVARQLITYGGAFSGVLLILAQPAVHILYGRQAAVVQRQRKAKVQHAQTPVDKGMRVAYLARPFKDKAATAQLMFLAQQVLIWLGAWIANGGTDAVANGGGASPAFGNFVVLLTLIVIWAMHSYTEPWESSYQNAASSRMYACHILTLCLGSLWNSYFDDASFSGLMSSLLTFTVILAPLLTLCYLGMGLRIYRRAAAFTDGVVTKVMPLWVRGMRWEDLPLPPGTVAIPCVYAGTPTTQAVYDALQGKKTKKKKKAKKDEVGESSSVADHDGSRRSEEFTRSLDRLLRELGEGLSGSSMSSSVRRYGPEATLNAHMQSLEQAQARVVARLEQYKKSLADDLPDASQLAAQGRNDVASSSDELAPAPSPSPSAATVDVDVTGDDGPVSRSADPQEPVPTAGTPEANGDGAAAPGGDGDGAAAPNDGAPGVAADADAPSAAHAVALSAAPGCAGGRRHERRCRRRTGRG